MLSGLPPGKPKQSSRHLHRPAPTLRFLPSPPHAARRRLLSLTPAATTAPVAVTSCLDHGTLLTGLPDSTLGPLLIHSPASSKGEHLKASQITHLLACDPPRVPNFPKNKVAGLGPHQPRPTPSSPSPRPRALSSFSAQRARSAPSSPAVRPFPPQPRSSRLTPPFGAFSGHQI